MQQQKMRKPEASTPAGVTKTKDLSEQVPEVDELLKEVEAATQKQKKKVKRVWVESCCGGHWEEREVD